MPVRYSPVPVRANPSALQNPFLGIAVTKAQRHAKSVQKKTLYRTKYLRCKAKREGKGKPAYPDPGARGLSSCKTYYTKWQKHRGKAGARALKLASKLERKGKLDPELKAALDADIAASSMESQIDPAMSEAELMAMADAGQFDAELGSEDVTPDNTVLYAAIGGVAVVGLLGGILLLRR